MAELEVGREEEVRSRNNGAFTVDKEWVGVDLDGTLAEFHGWTGITDIGEPIPAMVERVKRLYAEGKNIRILTARVGPPSTLAEVCAFQHALDVWCFKYIGTTFPATHQKDFNMVEFYDDRCKQVVMNKGILYEEMLAMMEKQAFRSIALIVELAKVLTDSTDPKIVEFGTELLTEYEGTKDEFGITEKDIQTVAENGVSH